jgi:hypothetical protein
MGLNIFQLKIGFADVGAEIVKFEKWLCENIGQKNIDWKRQGWDAKASCIEYSIFCPEKLLWATLICG